MSVKFPSSVVTVIVAVPADSAVINPLLFTVATSVSLLINVTALFVAFAGDTVAVIVSLSPTLSDVEFLFNVTPVTANGLT